MRKIKPLIPCFVWIIFCVVGLIQQRYGIAAISLLFCALSVLMVVLRKKRGDSSKKMWESFVKNNAELADDEYHIWRFVEGPEYRKNIFKRILNGEVTGESFSIDLFEANGADLPKIGEYNIVCDERDQAYCIVKTINITTTTFGAVNSHLAQVEGCKDVDQWKKYNKNKYERICEKLDIEFNRGLPLFFEEFEIVYK